MSLVAHVFKARYFRSSNFLDAKLGNNPSYLWRSLMATQDVIGRGAKQRLGDGSSTLV